MMLKTSSNNVNPATNMFKFTFKKNFGIIILVIIGFLLVCPSYMLLDMPSRNDDVSVLKSFLSGWIYGFSFFSAVFTAFAVTALNLLNFSYMFRRPSSDLFDSLPLTRNEIFFSKTLASVLLVLVPVFCSLFSLGIISVYYGFVSFILHILANFAYIVMIALLSSAFSMIFIVCSANVFDFLVSFVVINGGLLAVDAIIDALLSRYLIGYNYTATNVILRCTSPFYNFFADYYSFASKENLSAFKIKYFIFSIIFLAVLTVIGLLLFKKRKTESTGKAFAYKFMYYLCAIIISYVASYAFGAIFTDENLNSILFYIFAVIGSAICAVIYGAITFRGFKTIKKSIIVSGVSFVLFVISVILVKADIVGFNYKTPKKSEIKTATVSLYNDEIYMNDPQTIIDIQTKILNTDGVINKNDSYGPHSSYVEFSYLLKNNKKISRLYWIDFTPIKNDLLKVYASKERFDSIKNELNTAKPSTVYFYLSPTKDGEYEEFSEVYLTFSEITKLIDVYVNEVTTKNLDCLPDGYNGKSTMEFNFDLKTKRRFYSLAYTDEYTETIEYLNSLKLKERAEEIYGEAETVEYH